MILELHRHRPDDGAPWTYAQLDARQREVAAEVRGGARGRLLLSEVAPVITLGRRAALESELRLPPNALARLGIDVYPSDRGGLATYHGPGQWVLFAVDRLERLTGDSRGVRKLVCALLEVALETARAYGRPGAEIREGAELGVWSPASGSSPGVAGGGKLAAVGIHIERGVALHGLSLNVFKTAQSFVGLRPCGLEGAAVDYLLGDGMAPVLTSAATATKLAKFDEIGLALARAALRRLSSGVDPNDRRGYIHGVVLPSHSNVGL